ncbi:MAG: PIN domain-containing protein [Gammaproteobacteria bacterium]|nr:PIN domain-containing protein [Gammaproteobacteria bacterium]MDE0412531.1 PIN domain-containing protein [Gammaproteobacteria bacterium]
MCAIVDAHIASEVFSPDGPEAGQKFLEWINAGTGRLVTGGKLLQELYKTPAIKWMKEARFTGAMKIVNEQEVDELTEQLERGNQCQSDDSHVVALAQISGARLLYSNDKDLHKDFKNPILINNPRGKIYSTNEYHHFSENHKKLIEDKDLCRAN